MPQVHWRNQYFQERFWRAPLISPTWSHTRERLEWAAQQGCGSWPCCWCESTGGALVWSAGGVEDRRLRKGFWGNKPWGRHCRTRLDWRSGFVAIGKLGLCSFSSCFQADQLTFTSWASERHRKKNFLKIRAGAYVVRALSESKHEALLTAFPSPSTTLVSSAWYFQGVLSPLTFRLSRG